MKCPACPDTALVMTDRQGVEIDYCPKCRGVWLDRGELDKVIERSASQAAPQARRHDDDDDDDRRRGHHAPYPYPKRKSWLSELFD
jgi:Zn-finger nucleic acid-binding protein